MLNASRLRVLVEVARRGSFSAAATALDYTQSAVSQQIAALEAETGATLLERRPRGVRPTTAGCALIEHAHAILGRMDAAEAELAAIAGLRAGRLRMASFASAGAALMPLAVGIFRAKHPDIELSLAEGEPDEVLPRLSAGEIDLALLFAFGDTGLALPTGLESVKLLDDPLHVALPGDHPLAGRPSLALGDLRDVAWIQTSASSACARHVVRCCHTAGFEPRVAFESDDYATVQGLVAAGVGVALIPELALAGGVRSDIVVTPLAGAGAPARTVLAAAAPRAGPAGAAMLEILRDVTTRGRHVGARP